MHINRRHFFGLAASSALAAGPMRQAFASAPLGGAVAPVYRLKVGDIEVTAIADGYIDLDQKLFATANKDEAAKLLTDAFRPADAAIRASVNAFVVNTGDKLVLVDCGTIAGFSPTLAKLPERLEAAGFKPEQFDAVLLTHLHPDHVGAATAGDGVARFSKAQFIVAESEFKFWNDESIMAKAPKEAQPFFKIAQDAAKPYAKSMTQFAKDGEVAKGITSIALPGHTPGHTGYMVSSGSDSLLIWGDIVHAPALQFAHPDWAIAFDTDQAQAIASRKAIFDRAATDRVMVAGMHLDFPAFGHVTKEKDAYGFTPAFWRLDQ